MFELFTAKFSLHLTRAINLIIIALSGMVVTACVQPAYRVESRTVTPPPQTQLFYYPLNGQSQTQQDRDRYECHIWAVQKTGYDPGQAAIAPHQQVNVVSEQPSGANTAVGAFGGAVIGSMLSGPRQAGRGMVLGAITGALIGSAADSSQKKQAQQIENQNDDSYARQYAQVERQSHDYTRAMTACLEGRGYKVR